MLDEQNSIYDFDCPWDFSAAHGSNSERRIWKLGREAPQRGFSFAIRLVRLICSCGIFGLPGADQLFHLRHNLKPCWCHRITVSGLMISIVLCREVKLFIRTLKKNLSEGRSRGLGGVRVSISSCFLRYTISSWSWVLDLKDLTQNVRKDLNMCAFALLIERGQKYRFQFEFTILYADGVLTRYRRIYVSLSIGFDR